MIDNILEKAASNIMLSHSDAVKLLAVDPKGNDAYKLYVLANSLTRSEYGGRGYVFSQIGINSAKCSGGCKFCSLSQHNFCLEKEDELSIDEIVRRAKITDSQGIDALFLMTTADYSKKKFIEVASAVRAAIQKSTLLVANIGDFNKDYARQLSKCGVSAVYHIVRLREGEDTDISKEERIKTIDGILSCGMQLYYCVEPIGAEHTYEEIADEMLRARDYNVKVMAAMRRVAVAGTPMASRGTISTLELNKIAAVARLVTRPQTSMNVHEVNEASLMCGVNQLYAECGINPRDTAMDTASGRGYGVNKIRQILHDAEFMA